MILVLGSSGLLGNALIRMLEDCNLNYVGTSRESTISLNQSCLISVKDLMDNKELEALIKDLKPTAVINCLSLAAQMRAKNIWLDYLRLYSVLPRVLDMLSLKYDFKYIHISSDGVFDGLKGDYKEDSYTNAKDIYGISKILGEPSLPNSSCIRTSLYGHSLNKDFGIIDWVLRQSKCEGFSNYFFTGMSTLKLSEIIINSFIKEDNFGLFHLGGEVISKHDLLSKVVDIYGHKCRISKKDDPIINLSLNQDRFETVIGKKYFNHDTMLKELYVQYS
tara:strand:+ start:17320 stop:18150 length:831 start_codon:yes stop_codon:yes gene_type:complete